MQKRILIIYHTGTGGTLSVCKAFRERLEPHYHVDLIEANSVGSRDVVGASLLLFGFPVLCLQPSPSIMECLHRISQTRPLKAFAFLCKSLVSQNAMRTFIKAARQSNIFVGGSCEFRAPASDCTLDFSETSVERARILDRNFIYGYEKNVTRKLDNAVSEIEVIIRRTKPVAHRPKWKYYTPWLYLLQRIYFDSIDLNATPLQILDDRCTQCLTCVNTCPREVWSFDEVVGFEAMHSRCDRCMRCVHHCPAKAIIYNESMKDRPRLTLAFHKKAKQKFLDNR